MADVAHVVVLMLENRSYDHMLGYVPHPDPSFDGLSGRAFTNPGWGRGPAVAASPDAKQVLPVGPDHSHDAVMQQLALRRGVPRNRGFVRSYERKGRGLDPPAFGGLLGPLANWIRRLSGGGGQAVTGRGPLVMAGQPPGNVPVLGTLAREFAVCSRWFCSVPGETWPNRNFAHAATSDGLTQIEIRPYTNRTIFELLEDHEVDWRIYYDDTPQVWALHTLDHEPVVGSPDLSNSQHPENNLVSNAAYDTFTLTGESDFTRGEHLVATIYEALRARPDVFDKTVLLVTYDEHGGLYDHVPPPRGVPGPGGPVSGVGRLQRFLLYRKCDAFDFTMLGPRVPAVVISPRVQAGTVDVQTHDHASIPATLRALFAPHARPLTERDNWAAPFHGLCTLPEARADLPDLSAHATSLTSAITAPRAAVAAADTEPAAVPAYYEPFLAQAAQVQQHLAAVGEPEVATPATGLPADRGEQITREFAAAADRHRGSH